MSKRKPIRPSARTANITYAVRDVVILAQQAADEGKDLLRLNIGDPNLFDFTTPPHIVDAVVEAMRSNHCGYSPSSGIAQARQAIAAEAQGKGIRSVQDIFITTGASEAIDVALSALVNPGEKVLAPMPGYPLYSAVIQKLEAIETPYHLDEDNSWQPDTDDIAAKIDDKTRAIVVINPNNPTGSLAAPQALQAIVDLAARRGLVVLADEIYDKLLFDGARHVPLASLSDGVVVTFNGLSKSYLAPGFRLGWGIVSGPAAMVGDYVEAINKLLRARLSAHHPGQYGITAALEGDHSHLQTALEKLTRRRDLTVRMLNEIDGISCVAPGGAFYAFPRLHIDRPDTEFVKGLIRQTGVVVVPGSGFGQKQGTQHFRVAFLAPEQTLQQAYRKIDAFLRTFRKG